MPDITAAENDEIEIDYQVDNVGQADGTQDITLEVDGGEVDSESNVGVSASGSATGSLSWTPGIGNVGDYILGVVSDDHRARRSVRVESAIPDNEDLLSRYDFTQEDGTTPVTDLSGNDNHLDEGSYSGVSAAINGVQAGLFDGVGDYVSGQFGNESQPNHVFAVFEVVSTDTSANEYIFDSYSVADQGMSIDSLSSANKYSLFAGNGLNGNTTAQAGDIVVASGLFDGGSSVLRLNSSQDGSGDAGTDSLDGVTIGSNGGGSDYFANVKVGEVLVYPMDKSDIVTDVEQYFIDRWGPVGFA